MRVENQSGIVAEPEDGIYVEPHRAKRLVVVSNRVALPHTNHAGGLAQGMRAMLEQRGGIWAGWSGREHSDAYDVHYEHAGRIDYLTFDVPEDVLRQYYWGYANSALWPLMHGRTDVVVHTTSSRKAYETVNARFAQLLAGELADDDLVWVHDYHLIPLARLLRERGLRCRLGFFLHTPMPAFDVFSQLPGYAGLLRDLASYDLVGVQTEADADALRRSLMKMGGRRVGTSVVGVDGSAVQVAAFPIGVDADALATLAQDSKAPHAAALQQSLAGRALLIGVDRLDYSKGLPERIRAFGRLLAKSPEWRRKLTFLQVAPESRIDVPEYRRLRNSVQRLVGSVNGRYGDESWTPLRYVNRVYSHEELATFYHHARVGIVTPLRDGMNLVAKEFIACQNPMDPGVLVLSEFAGAARELSASLIVNPHDTEQCADAIKQALEMPREERVERWQADMTTLRAHSIHDWGRNFVAALEAPLAAPTSPATNVTRLTARGDGAARIFAGSASAAARHVGGAGACPE